MNTGKPVEKLWEPNNKLTAKQNAFVRHIVNNPKDSYTSAAMATFNAKTRAAAGVIAHDVRNKPAVKAELAKYSNDAEGNLIKLATATTEYALEGGKEGAAYASVAEKVNNSILDRLHGKATQKVQQETLAVTLNVDLTGQAG